MEFLAIATLALSPVAGNPKRELWGKAMAILMHGVMVTMYVAQCLSLMHAVHTKYFSPMQNKSPTVSL